MQTLFLKGSHKLGSEVSNNTSNAGEFRSLYEVLIDGTFCAEGRKCCNFDLS